MESLGRTLVKNRAALRTAFRRCFWLPSDPNRGRARIPDRLVFTDDCRDGRMCLLLFAWHAVGFFVENHGVPV